MPRITKLGGPSDAITAPPTEEPEEDCCEDESDGEEAEVIEIPDDGEAEVSQDGPEGDEIEEAPEQPARNASREAWAEYVTAVYGVEVPEETTRAELIELYGS
jgi:hypothetical protein